MTHPLIVSFDPPNLCLGMHHSTSHNLSADVLTTGGNYFLDYKLTLFFLFLYWKSTHVTSMGFWGAIIFILGGGFEISKCGDICKLIKKNNLVTKVLV